MASDASRAYEAGFDAYKMLGVPKDTTEDEIRKAYYRAAKKYHPDRGGGFDAAHCAEKFKQVSRAYEILSDKSLRAEYDSYCAHFSFIDPTDTVSLLSGFTGFWAKWTTAASSIWKSSIRLFPSGVAAPAVRRPPSEAARVIFLTLEDVAVGANIQVTSKSRVYHVQISPGIASGRLIVLPDETTWKTCVEPHSVFVRGGGDRVAVSRPQDIIATVVLTGTSPAGATGDLISPSRLRYIWVGSSAVRVPPEAMAPEIRKTFAAEWRLVYPGGGLPVEPDGALGSKDRNGDIIISFLSLKRELLQ